MEEIQGFVDIQQQDLEVHDWLGNGASGGVFQGVWRNNGKEQVVAIKKMKVSGKEMADEICTELKGIQSIQCEHLCKVHGGCVVNNGEQVWLVMEFVDGGDLHNFLTKYPGPLPKDLLFPFCIQATKALAFLHSAFPSPIQHRDIKSLNFLVQNKSKLLLTDFGLSVVKSLAVLSVSTIGTVRWLAPEIVATNKPQWSEQADIYSLGMVFYEIMTRTLPYQEESNLNNIVKKIKSGILPRFPADFPKELAAIIQSCLAFKPSKRPRASELLDSLERLVKASESPLPASPLDTIIHRCSESAQTAQSISTEINAKHMLDIFYFPQQLGRERRRGFAGKKPF